MKINWLNEFLLNFRPKVRKEHTCIHEAGHAVATCLLGFKLHGIEIINNKVGFSGWNHREGDDNSEKEMPIFYAGTAAEILIFGKAIPNHRDGRHVTDFENAWRHAALITLKPNSFPREPKFIMGDYYVTPQIQPEMIPDGKTIEQISASIAAMEEKGIVDAFNILSPHIETIKRVAAQLEQKGKLSGDEVRSLII
jgi:Peptidase M50B-like